MNDSSHILVDIMYVYAIRQRVNKIHKNSHLTYKRTLLLNLLYNIAKPAIHNRNKHKPSSLLPRPIEEP